MEKAMIRTLNTKEFASEVKVQPQTIRRAYCLTGHYCGIQPIKLPNRLLAWRYDEIEKLLSSKASI